MISLEAQKGQGMIVIGSLLAPTEFIPVFKIVPGERGGVHDTAGEPMQYARYAPLH